MLKHRLTSVFFLTGPNRCFFASSQFVCYKTLLFIYFSKMEEVSTSVRDSKSTLPTPQANFLKKQFYQLWSIFFFNLFEYGNWIEFYS